MPSDRERELAEWRERAILGHNRRTTPRVYEIADPHPHEPEPPRVEYDGEAGPQDDAPPLAEDE